MHGAVGHVLEGSPLAAVEAEVRAFAPAERRLPARCREPRRRQGRDHRVAHLPWIDLAVERQAGPRGLRALAGLEVVVRQGHVEERRRHGRLAGVVRVDGVPVRQGPGLVLQRVLDDALERGEVHPVPRQEVPAAVLAVAPELVAGVGAAEGTREAVDGRLEPPPQRVGGLLPGWVEIPHPADGQLVGLQYVGPVPLRIRPVPHICPSPSHLGLPFPPHAAPGDRAAVPLCLDILLVWQELRKCLALGGLVLLFGDPRRSAIAAVPRTSVCSWASRRPRRLPPPPHILRSTATSS